MKLLIAYGSKGKIFHMKKFMEELIKLGIECKLVKDSEYSVGFPSKNPNEWFSGNKGFKKLVHEFKPDAIFVDKQSHFGAAAIDANLVSYSRYEIETPMCRIITRSKLVGKN